MPRLYQFDYKTPFFYMVTLKRLPGLADFSAIGEGGQLEKNSITVAFENTIDGFHRKWRCIEKISPFVVMPDHIHLMIKIKPTSDRVALGGIVSQLMKALRADYWRVVAADAATRKTLGIAPCASAQGRRVIGETGVLRGGASAPPPVFQPEWHDWIVKRDGQLAAFRRYIRENPARAALRRSNACFFGKVRSVSFLGREWFAYGNCDLLALPVLIPIKGHRATQTGSPEWNALVAAASRIGPGGAGVSTFMSTLEKACGNAIVKAGGAWIVLSPEGFPPRWHPPREKERFCANGRMLFLSLYEASSHKPTRKMLYDRCHEMIDLVVSGLAPIAPGLDPCTPSPRCRANGRITDPPPSGVSSTR